MHLSNSDFDALQRAILDLHEPATFDEFKHRLVVVAQQIIPNDYTLWHRYSFAPKPVLTSYVESTSRITRDWQAEAETLLPLHPCAQYLARTGDPSALKLSDFISQRQLRGSFMWPLYKSIECGYNLAVAIQADASGVTVLGLNRKSRDFAERDRLMLNLLRPHIAQSERIAKQFGLQARSHELAVSPQSLSDRFGLSPREIQIVHWVAQGKSNPEIALILSISPRTIEKHMERILAKLGVENRNAAALLLTRLGTED